MVILSFFILTFGFSILLISSFWKVFEKAGHPGWAAIVPIYNAYILFQIAGKPFWWIFIPILNIYAAFVVNIEIAKKFGKDTGFGLGLMFLGIIFWPMLAFGNAEYVGAEMDETDHLVT